MLRACSVRLLAAVLLVGLSPSVGEGQYVQRELTTTHGAVTFIGNTLGLNRDGINDRPGTTGSIGTFTTTNTNVREDFDWPLGTTFDWRQNSSAAILNLPPNSRVVHAELIWGGSYNFAGENVAFFLDDPVEFRTPAGLSQVTPALPTRFTLSGSQQNYYTRTADVTALVTAGRNGTYTVGRVPATQGNDADFNAAGWTLAIVYENSTLPARNLSLFVGLERVGGGIASVASFCTPSVGPVRGRVAVSAIDGDTHQTGDSLRFGPTLASLASSQSRLAGPNNPITNFFASQINGDNGLLVTSGTFGTRNNNFYNTVAGGRQGWDITNVDASAQLTTNQTTAFATGTTTFEFFYINALALQIDVGAPAFDGTDAFTVSQATATVGDVLTYTARFDNSQGTANASNLTMTVPLPAGMSFVTGSFTLDGSPSAANPVTGALIGNVAAGATRVATFRFRVDSVPAPPAPAQYDVAPTLTYTFVSCAGQPSEPGSFTGNTVTTTIPRITAAKSGLPESVRPTQVIDYRISVTNTGSAASNGTLVKDLIPAGTAYVLNSTTLNGTPVADQQGTSPLVLGMLVNSPGAGPGLVNPGEAADVRFVVRVGASTTAAIVNTALIDPDGLAGVLPEIPASVTTTVTPLAEIELTNVGPVTATAGTDITYVITLTNEGPSTANDVVLTNPTPPGLTLVSVTGDCTALPCSLGAVEAGTGFGIERAAVGERVVNVTFHIPGPYTTPDPIVSSASATTTTEDLTPGDDAASASTSLSAPVADLQITNDNGVNRVVPGQTVTYQIVVTNAGPSTAVNAVVTDAFPLLLQGVTWTCVATAGAQCATPTGTGNINAVVTVPTGGSLTFTATGTLATTATGTLVNEAQVVPAAGTSDPTPAAEDDIDTIDLQADLSITISAPASVALGGEIVYTSVITNNGPSTASNVVIEIDNTPDLILVSSTSPCTTSPCNIGTLAPGATRTDTTTFRVPVDLVGNTVTSTTRISSGVEDPDATDNQSVFDVAIIRDADVALVKSVSPETVLVGEQATFIVTVTNVGPAPATGMVVRDLLPVGLTLDSVSESQGSYVPATGEWTVGDLEVGRFATLSLVATLDVTGVVTNLATIAARGQPDPLATNDSAAVEVNGLPAADVAVTKTVDNAAPPVSSTVTFTVTATNQGPSQANGVVVTDSLPAGLTQVTATPSQGTYTAPTWNVGTVDAGSPATLIIVATVDAPGGLVNTAAKTQQVEADPNIANDSASVTLNAAESANLTVFKLATRAGSLVAVGETLTFDIIVLNRGPNSTTGVRVSDVLPPGLTFVSASPAEAYDPITGVWTVGDLGVGDLAVLALTVRVAQPGILTNTASIAASDRPDPDTSNDSSSVTITADRIAEVGVAQAFTGSTTPALAAGYTIVVTNHGPSDVTGVAVTDVLPAALLAPSWTCVADAGSSCTAAAGTGSIATTVTLQNGDTATFTVGATIAGGATGTLVNTVTVAVPAGVTDGDPANDSATTSVPLTPAADLQISKDGPASAVAGTNLVYTTVVTNAGPSDAVAVTVTDPTPPGLTFLSNAGDCMTVSPCALGTLAFGAVRTITTTYAIPSAYVTPNPITNTATVASATTLDPAAANNISTATTGLGNPVTDLHLTKTNGVSSLVPGQTTTYTITLSNSGPTDAIGARLQDDFPAALTGVSWTCAATGGGACGAASGSGDIDIVANVPVGASVVVTATGTVAANATGFLVNTATAAPPAGLAVRSTPTATDTDQLVPQADLSVTKSGPASVLLGGVITYTITVANAGPSDAIGVLVEDIFQGGLAFVSNAGDCTTAFPCALGTVPAGATRTITATVSVPVAYAGPSPITNIAEVTATTPDPDVLDNTATAETALDRGADVGVVKSVSPAMVLVGEQATFTVTVTNAGPARAQGLVVRDLLPEGLTLDSFTVSQGSYLSATGDWTVGAVDAGQSPTLTLVATLEVTGAVTNFAAITATDQPDPNPSNDSAAVEVNGQPAADIAVTKTVDNPTPAVGSTVTFTVTATNRGPTGATGVVVTDALPAGLTLVSATPSQGDYTAPAWTVGALAVDTSETLVIVATVDTPGGLVNKAEKTQQVEADPTTANDSASVTLNAAESANLKILKATTRSMVSVGETLTFNVLVVNLGPGPATGVRVSDVLPPGLTFVSSKPDAAYNPTTGVWTLGALGANTPAVLTLTVLVTQAGALTNTASIIASDQPDPDPTDNADSATVTAVVTADVGVTQAFTGATTPGLAAGYTIVVTNHGPSSVAGVTVTDLLPATLVAPSWTCAADAGSLCAATAGTGSIATTVTLRAGGTATFTVGATIAAGATGTLVNTVTVAVPPGVTDGDATNNSATTSVPLTPAADLQISKDGPASAVAGTTIVYTTVVTSAGPSDALAVTVADVTPPGLTFVSNAGACTTAFPCALGTLASGAVSTITTTYTIPPGYLTPDPIVNTATVASATPDPAAANNSSTAMTELGASVTDLRITKTNGVSSLVPGQATTYTITVTNNGPSNAIGARVQDLFPAALTGVSWTCAASGGGACGTASGTGNIDIAVDVPVGATVVVTATGTVAANATGFLVNTATAVPPAGMAALSTPTATDTDQLLPQADLSVTKTGPVSVVPGNSIVYTTTITNNGLSDAAGVTVTDPTPPGLTFVSNAGDCTTAFPCALGIVPAAATRTITTTFTVPVGYAGPSPIANIATVSATTPDPDASDNTATAQTPVNRDADVQVVKSVSPATVLAGEQATFTVTVSNAGPARAQGLVVRDLLPGGLTLDSFTVSQGSYVPATGTWTVGTVDAGQPAVLTLVATLAVAGEVTNLAVITAKDQPDPDTSNNAAVAVVNGQPAADIAVTKTVDTATPTVGSTVTFIVTATNRGPTGATGVVVTDALPAGLTLVSATPLQGDYTAPTWTVGALAANASATLVIVATVDTPGALVNTATKTQQVEADPNPANDSASVSLNAAASANLKVLKVATRPTVSVGETLTFNVLVVNRGPSPATGVAVSDVLPPGLTFVSANPAAAYDAITGVWTVGDLDVSGLAVLALTVRATQAGALTNTASIIASDQPDPDPTDDASSATVTAALAADVGVAQAFTGAATPGLAAGYSIVVTNHGPSDVAGVTVTDVLPAVLVAPSWTCVADAGSTCAAAAGTGSIATTVTLQAGDTATFTVGGTIAAGATGTLVNTVTVAVPPGVTDGDATNNSATTSVPLTPAADLQISKDGPAIAVAGTNVVYTTVVTNAGPSDAVAVTVADPTPPGLTFVSNAAACTTAFPCALGTLAAGAVSTITTTYAIPPGYLTPDPITNTATVASATPDPAPANNSSTAMTGLNAPVTDLRIAKTNGVSSLVPGRPTTYTITLTNNGPSDAAGARLQDAFPAALTGVSWTCAGSAGGACGAASGNGNIDIAVDVPVGATVVVTATGTVAANATGLLVNTATAVPPVGLAVRSTPTATDTDQLLPQADLSVTKSGPASVVLGGAIVYTTTITNGGPSDAAGVTVADTTPPGLTFVSNAGDCTTAFPCALGAVPAGATRTITTTFTVPVGYTGPSPIANVAAVSATTPDPDASDNTATAQTTVNGNADVSIVKTVSPATVLVGEQATFTVTVSNAGPARAIGLVVHDLLPVGLTLDSFSVSQGSYVPATGDWTVGAVDVGESATLTLVATLEVTGVVTNLATITAKDQPDPDTSNDSAAAEVNGAPAADIAVTKTVDSPTPVVGSTVTFTVTATNRGPTGATGVVVTDALPAGLTQVSATPSQGTYTAPTWTVGALAVDDSATLTIVATVDAPGGLVNTATKTLQVEADPTTANDSASVTLNAAASANLKIVKAATRSTVSVGETLTFNVQVVNVGPSPATGVAVSDVLPPGLTFVSANPAAAYDGLTGLWTVGDLAVNAPAVLALTVRATQAGALTNTASIVASDQPDPDPADNAASATITATVGADVGVTQAFTGTTTPGLAAGYSIVVTNHGPSDVAGVTVTDLLPAVLVAPNWTCVAAAGSSCAAAAGTGSIATTVTLQAGDTATFTVGGTIAAGATGTLVNTVTVAVPPGVTDGDAANNSATTSVVLTPAADVQISKGGPASAVAGTSIVYTTVVTNAGPSDALAVTVADVTPPGLTFVSNADACTTAFPCALGTLAAGAVRTITTTYAIPPGYLTPAPIVNTATVASGTPDPAAANDSSTATTALGASVTDLRIAKTNAVSSLVPGHTTTYTIAVTNTGPSNAIGVRVQDLFPAALTGVSWTCAGGGGGACGTASGTGNIDILVDVPVGASVVVTATGTVAANATGFLVNTATAVPPAGLVARSTPTATDTDELVPQADLRVTKTGPVSVLPGNPIVYTITVTNDGPSDAAGVSVADPTPPGLTFVSNAGDCTTAFPCALGAVPAGATRTITTTFSVPVGYAGLSPITNFATVSATTPDPDASDNTATAGTPVNRDADVRVVKSVSPAMVLVGGQATFTVTVTNAGPARAQGLVVHDPLPGGLTLDSFTVSQGSYAPATGKWTVGALDVGQPATLTLVATLTVAGEITNFAAITGRDQPDPDTSNDVAAAAVNGQPAADIAVTKTVDTATPTVGSTVTFIVTATNRGPTGATGVVVTDALPAGLTLVSATPLQGTYTAPAWTVGALAANASATLIVAATVDTPGALVNTAAKTQQIEADPNPANDSASVTLNAAESANLKILKATTRSTVSVGETMTFFALVVNLGPSPATGVRVSDVLPPGLTFVSANPAAEYDATTGIWTVGDLDVRMPAALALTVRVTQGGALTNTATIIASDQPDPDPTDNAASATVTAAVAADVGVAQVFTGSTTPGFAAGYKIVVVNQGPSDVAGVTVSDPFPAPFTGITWTCTAAAGSTCAAAAGTGSIATTVTLQAGDTAIFTVAGAIAAGATGPLVNTVTVAVPVGVTDGDAADNSATTSVPLTPAADLQIVKDGPPAALAGTSVVYTTVVTNAGPSDAVAVTVTDPTPPGLTFVSNAGACTTASPCALGTLAAGAVSTIITTYAIPAEYVTPDPIVNTATVASATPDPAAANNSSTAMTGIGASVTDLRIAKTDGFSSLVPGQTTTYTITVTNNGPSAAIGTRVRDAFPAALTGVSWTCAGSGGGACGIASGTGDIDIAVDVPVGATVVVTATGTVAANATGLLVNTATASPPAGLAFRSLPIAVDVDELRPQADLRVTKTGPSLAVRGDSIVYTITVVNDGPSDAAGVTVGDLIPQGLTFVSNAGDCTTAFPCALGIVPAGATRTITTTFSVPVGYAGPSPITNVTAVSSTTPDPDASDNTASAETPLDGDADVEVTKVVPASDVLVGDEIVITINALNHGPNPATGIEITDQLPAGFDFVSASATQGGYDAATGIWSVGSLSVGTAEQLTMTVLVTEPGPITNLAAKTAQNEPDPNTTNDSAAGSTASAPAADLAVKMDVDRRVVPVGETVTFTVRATNRGPSPATGVELTDALPVGLSFVSATASLGSYDQVTGIWTVGALDAAGQATLTLVATVDQAGPLVNNAAVTAQAEADPNPLNRRDAVLVNAASSADLSVTKAVSQTTPGLGSLVSYTIAVANLGPADATSAVIGDPLPAGVVFDSASASQGSYDAGTGTWTVGALPVTRTATLTLTGRVTQTGPLVNTTTRVSSAPVDPNPANDAASATLTASIVADVSVVKTPSAPTIAAGAPLAWTITVANSGPSIAAGVSVTDAFSPVFSGVTWTCTATAGSACALLSGVGAIGTTVDLAAGGSATFVANGAVDPTFVGNLANTASAAVASGTTDPNPANNSASSTVAAGQLADVQLTSTGPASASPGSTIQYVSTIVNAGPSQADGATLFLVNSRGGLTAVPSVCTSLPCALGSFAPGETRNVTSSVTIPPDYQGPITLVVRQAVNTQSFDPVPANNSAVVTTTIGSGSGADLSISKAGPATTNRGQQVTYTILVANAGPAGATGVTVHDPTPAGLTFVSNGGDCVTAFPCDLATMAAGTTRIITATYAVATGTSGPSTITNTASVQSGTSDPDVANNSASVVTRLPSGAKCDFDGDGLDEIVTGAGPSGGPHVRLLKVSGATVTELAGFYAYEPTFKGGAFVACGDVTGDGLPEIITGAGAGGSPHVRVFAVNAGNVTEVASFQAYAETFRGGVHVAAADTTGDGVAEIITGAGPSGGPHVRVLEFNGGDLTELASFYAYDVGFTGGVSVAGADIDGDGLAEVITGAGPSGGPHVRVISLRGDSLTELTGFYAYDPTFFLGGVDVAAADVTGDGIAEIITGAGPSGGPHVRVFAFDGVNLTELTGFYAYDPTYFLGGVHVAAADVTGDGIAEIITGAGPSGGPHVKVIAFDGTDLTVLASFYAYDPTYFLGGVNVASAETPREGEAATVLAQGFRGGAVNGHLVNGLALARITRSWAADLASSSRVTLTRLTASWPASPPSRLLPSVPDAAEVRRFAPMIRSPPCEASSEGFSARARGSPT